MPIRPKLLRAHDNLEGWDLDELCQQLSKEVQGNQQLLRDHERCADGAEMVRLYDKILAHLDDVMNLHQRIIAAWTHCKTRAKTDCDPGELCEAHPDALFSKAEMET